MCICSIMGECGGQRTTLTVLATYGFRKLNSGRLTCQQVSLPVEPSCWPSFCVYVVCVQACLEVHTYTYECQMLILVFPPVSFEIISFIHLGSWKPQLKCGGLKTTSWFSIHLMGSRYPQIRSLCLRGRHFTGSDLEFSVLF